MSLRTDDMYHIAMVVPDVDATCQELTRTSHVTWSPEIRTDISVWTRETGKVETLSFRAVYSLMAPHIEVVQSIPGTFMASVPDRPLHHVGYWADDLAAESEWLERQGVPLVACAMADGDMFGFAFHVTRDGLLQELVDRAAFPDWEGFLNGKTAFSPIAPPAKDSDPIRWGAMTESTSLESICDARRFCPPARLSGTRLIGSL